MRPSSCSEAGAACRSGAPAAPAVGPEGRLQRAEAAASRNRSRQAGTEAGRCRRPLPPAAGAARRGPAQALANMMTGRAGGRGGRAAPLGAGAAGRGGDIWAQLCRSFAPGRCRTAALSGCYAARPWRPGLQRTLLLHVPRVPACLLPAGYRFALLPAPPELANLQGRAICMAGRIKEHGQHGQDLLPYNSADIKVSPSDIKISPVRFGPSKYYSCPF